MMIRTWLADKAGRPYYEGGKERILPALCTKGAGLIALAEACASETRKNAVQLQLVGDSGEILYTKGIAQ